MTFGLGAAMGQALIRSTFLLPELLNYLAGGSHLVLNQVSSSDEVTGHTAAESPMPCGFCPLDHRVWFSGYESRACFRTSISFVGFY